MKGGEFSQQNVPPNCLPNYWIEQKLQGEKLVKEKLVEKLWQLHGKSVIAFTSTVNSRVFSSRTDGRMATRPTPPSRGKVPEEHRRKFHHYNSGAAAAQKDPLGTT